LVSGDTARTSGSLTIDDAMYSFLGESGGDEAGTSVAIIDDVDGDDLADILIGAYLNGSSGAEAGTAYLVLSSSLGSTSEISLSSADYIFMGVSAGDHAGYAVAGAGDLDSDGYGDIIIGAPGRSSDAGSVYIVTSSSLGASSSISLSSSDYEFQGARGVKAGAALASAGDVDGDGNDDILIGAPGTTVIGDDAGTAYLVRAADLLGEETFELGSTGYAFLGESEGDKAGEAVASAGDVDGDGYDDILIGAPQDDDAGANAGAAYVILGSSLGATTSLSLSTADYKLTGEKAGNTAGRWLHGASDMDGDDLDDIVISSPGYDGSGTDLGAVHLVFGDSLSSAGSSFDLADYDHRFVGATAYDQLGASVTSAGDINGDGLSDLLMGAPGNDDEATNAGKAYLLLAENSCNSAPTAPEVSISPSDPTAGEDDLVCSIDSESYDPDGDTISYTFEWEVDGVSSSDATTTTETGDTISADDLSGDEEWTCTVTADDGTDESDSDSSTVTVTGASCSPDTETYDEVGTSTFTVPAGCSTLNVTIWGSGGGGGSGSIGSGYGGAGGGGGYISTLISTDPGDTYTVIVGAGGTGALAGNRNGGDGDTSSFGSSLQSTGGGGGMSASLGGVGGDGGIGSGAGIGESGSAGGTGTFSAWATGGDCGGSDGGRGGGNVFEGGRPPSPPGGGGGSAGGSGQTGGDGARGEISVSWSD
jgi:hypothetical protein